MKTEAIHFKQGVHWKKSHGLWAPTRILEVALETAPDTEDGLLWVTGGWREPRDPRELDLHNLCLAWDFRIRNFSVARGTDQEEYDSRRTLAWGWVNMQRDKHEDRRFQFDVHGEGANIHTHAEFDPR